MGELWRRLRRGLSSLWARMAAILGLDGGPPGAPSEEKEESEERDSRPEGGAVGDAPRAGGGPPAGHGSQQQQQQQQQQQGSREPPEEPEEDDGQEPGGRGGRASIDVRGWLSLDRPGGLEGPGDREEESAGEEEEEASAGDWEETTSGEEEASAGDWEEAMAGATGPAARGPERPSDGAIVSTGFASFREPAIPLGTERPLEPGTAVLLWFEVGRPVAGAIDRAPRSVDLEALPADARLEVVVSGTGEGLEPKPGATVGRLRLVTAAADDMAADDTAADDTAAEDDDRAGGGASPGVRRLAVEAQPGAAAGVAVAGLPEPLAGRRLFFPLRVTFGAPGPRRLRLDLFFRGVLLQGRMVTAWVGTGPPEADRPALVTDVVDYRLSESLGAATLAGLGPHAATLMLDAPAAEDGSRVGEGARDASDHAPDGALDGAGGGPPDGGRPRPDLGVRLWAGEAAGSTAVTGAASAASADAADTDAPVARAAGTAAADPVHIDNRLPAHTLADLVDQSRRVLRRVAWGDDEEWDEGKSYRYRDGRLDRERLGRDLVSLARNGLRFWTSVIDPLAGGWRAADRLSERLAASSTADGAPVYVQIVNQDRPHHILPAALLYDFRKLDTNRVEDGWESLCPAFRQALDDGSPVAETECFAGRCPSRERWDRVCPSGFWGFRLALGLPVSLGGEPGGDDGGPRVGEVATELAPGGPSRAEVAFYDFPSWPGHRERLAVLLDGWSVAEHSDRDDALEELERQPQPQLVYFYCHGGLRDRLPYLEVGSKASPGYFTHDNFFGLDWRAARPLVIVNGCHTTAVTPERAFDLVQTLTGRPGASGVIGTEITIFESLATAFAEGFLGHFLGRSPAAAGALAASGAGLPLGEAVRRTRLDLLQAGNPLGLVYIPFALASLRYGARGGA